MLDRRLLARRQVLKILGTAGSASLLRCREPDAAPPAEPLATGTPADPDLVSPTTPWDSVLTPEEMRTATALCDVIIPADDRSPSAADLAVPEFINEWVSAPYPSQRNDLIVVRGGLAWLNTQATERFGSDFAGLTRDQHHAICDDICYTETARPAFQAAARFFRLFRNLTATGFYTTQEGMDDLGYVGNRALPQFDGPPPDVLRHLGLDA